MPLLCPPLSHSGNVAGSVGAKVQHFSEITVILYVERLFKAHFYAFFAVSVLSTVWLSQELIFFMSSSINLQPKIRR